VSAQLIGTGPFRLKRHLPSTLVELERNPAYHIPGRPYLDGLRFSIVPDRSNAFSGFIGGSYQIYSSHSMKQSDQDTLRDGTGDTVEVTLAPTTLRYAVFMNGRRRPFDDLRVRQAISLALDRDAAIKVVRDGAGRRGGYMMPKGVWALPEGDLRRYEGYDRPAIDKARQLLQQSGAPPAFEAITVTRTDQRDFGEFVRDQLGKAGIIVRLSPIDTTTAQPILQRGDFDLALWPIGFGLDDPDATFGDLATRKAARNWSAVYDPQIDLLFEKQSQTVNLDERKKLVQELEKQALSQYQHAALFFEDLFVARYKIVRDFVVQESQYSNRRMENVWLKQ
jgi:peptide/nickel transport system substrate-binding protein